MICGGGSDRFFLQEDGDSFAYGVFQGAGGVCAYEGMGVMPRFKWRPADGAAEEFEEEFRKVTHEETRRSASCFACTSMAVRSSGVT